MVTFTAEVALLVAAVIALVRTTLLPLGELVYAAVFTAPLVAGFSFLTSITEDARFLTECLGAVLGIILIGLVGNQLEHPVTSKRRGIARSACADARVIHWRALNGSHCVERAEGDAPEGSTMHTPAVGARLL